MYKRADKKVKPVDTALFNSSVPEGDLDQKRKRIVKIEKYMQYGSKFNKYYLLKFSLIKRGIRLTEERL